MNRLRALGIGQRIGQRLRVLGYWKNGRPDIGRFARERGYLSQSLYLWLKDAAAPNLDNLRRLAGDLGVSAEWLTFGSIEATAALTGGGETTLSGPRDVHAHRAGEQPVAAPARESADIGHVLLHPRYASQLTERLEGAIQALRESEGRLRAFLDQQLIGVGFVGPDRRFTVVNRRFSAMLGREPGELVGKLSIEVTHPDDDTERFELYRKLLSGEIPYYQREKRFLSKDGAEVWARIFVSRLDQANGEPYALLLAEDITAHRQAQQALRESEERARLIIDQAYDAFITMDSSGAVVDWNRQAEVTFGWARNEVIGRSLAETIIPPRYREAHERGLQRFLDSGQGQFVNRRTEITALHRDGHEFPAELTLSPLRLGRTYFFNSFIHDISERKRAESALRESEERYRTLFMDDLTANFLCSPDGRLILCNPAFVRLCEFPSMEQALGADLTVFLDAETRKRVWEHLRRVRRIEWAEATVKTLSGRERHVIGSIVADYGVDKRIERIKGYIFLGESGRGPVQERKASEQEIRPAGASRASRNRPARHGRRRPRKRSR
jgi:PAS domain S-box-containing protein